MKLKTFQKTDLARLALHDGAILGWDKGLGKTLGMLLWALLKVNAKGKSINAEVSDSATSAFSLQPSALPVPAFSLQPSQACLLVAPGDVHDAVIDEAREKLGITVLPLDSQATFLALSRLNPTTGERELPPGFYLTSYTQLATNKIAKYEGQRLNAKGSDPDSETSAFSLQPSALEVAQFHAARGEHFAAKYEALNATPDMALPVLERRYRQLLAAAQRDGSKWREKAVEEAWALLRHFHGNWGTVKDKTVSGSVSEPVSESGTQAGSSPAHRLTGSPAYDLFFTLPPESQTFVRRLYLEALHREFRAGIGEIQTVSRSVGEPVSEKGKTVSESVSEPVSENGVSESGSHSPTHRLTHSRFQPTHDPTADTISVKCVYSPSLADLCRTTFAAVAIDEATKIKGEDSLIGVGIRQMSPRYRLVLTGTPIKNRVPDIFRLAHWATGGHAEATARWPYACGTSERDAFAAEFLVSERNVSESAGKPVSTVSGSVSEPVSGSGASESGSHSPAYRLTHSRPQPTLTGSPAHDRRNPKYRTKLTPQVCNIHRLWKLLGPIVLRRLKKDCAEELVAKHRHVIRVPMGSEQARVYQHHLEGEYLDRNGRKAVGAQLQALRVVAAAPHSDLLHAVPQARERYEVGGRRYEVEGNGSESESGSYLIPHTSYLPSRSASSYIPKYAAALTLIEQVLARREQIVIFSALIEPLETLHRRLEEAGVPHLVAHGGSSPARRRKISAQFKLGPTPTGKAEGQRLNAKVGSSELQPSAFSLQPSRHIPVLLASGECMAEAHSWHLCNNVALLAYSWAYDKLSQAIDRCHRLNSIRALNYYAIVCDGSVDRKLEQNIQEKGDASDLVLDGHLLGENPEELNLSDLLAIAAKEFHAGTKTIDEAVLEAEWPALRERLRHAAAAWGKAEESKAEGKRLNAKVESETSAFSLQPSAFSPPLAEPRSAYRSFLSLRKPVWRMLFGVTYS